MRSCEACRGWFISRDLIKDALEGNRTLCAKVERRGVRDASDHQLSCGRLQGRPAGRLSRVRQWDHVPCIGGGFRFLPREALGKTAIVPVVAEIPASCFENEVPKCRSRTRNIPGRPCHPHRHLGGRVEVSRQLGGSGPHHFCFNASRIVLRRAIASRAKNRQDDCRTVVAVRLYCRDHASRLSRSVIRSRCRRANDTGSSPVASITASRPQNAFSKIV